MKEKLNKYQQESKEFINKWEEKSRDFIHNFLDHFGNNTLMVADRVHRAISPTRENGNRELNGMRRSNSNLRSKLSKDSKRTRASLRDDDSDSEEEVYTKRPTSSRISRSGSSRNSKYHDKDEDDDRIPRV